MYVCMIVYYTLYRNNYFYKFENEFCPLLIHYSNYCVQCNIMSSIIEQNHRNNLHLYNIVYSYFSLLNIFFLAVIFSQIISQLIL